MEFDTPIKHRQFLQKVKFKDLNIIHNEEILDKIHVNYRLTYLRDTAMARFIEDSTISTLNKLIFMNSQEIVNYIFNNTDSVLDTLLEQMQNAQDLNAKGQAIEFFFEIC